MTSALLSSMLEVFRVRGPGNRCQSWLDSKKYTAGIKFPKSRQGLNCSGFQRASLCLSPVLGVVSLSWEGAWHSEAVGSAVSLIILASWARNSQGFFWGGKGRESMGSDCISSISLCNCISLNPTSNCGMSVCTQGNPCFCQLLGNEKCPSQSILTSIT